MASITSGKPQAETSGVLSAAATRTALWTLTSLFFMWGFLTCLNDIIIPHLKAVFELSYFQAMLVQFCFFSAYGLTSVPAGFVVGRIGYRNGLMLGLGTAALGCIAFYPAAGVHSYGLFLGALFVLAIGIVILQVSANPYVAVLGPEETASSRLTLTQAFNALATALAPAFGAAFILSVPVKSASDLSRLSTSELAAYRASEASSVQVPYLGLALALLLLCVVIRFARLPSLVASPEATTTPKTSISAWRSPRLVLGAVGIFAYVGAEVAIGSLLVSYMKELGGWPEAVGAQHLSYYWGGAMVGRFIGAVTLRWYRPGRVLALHAGLATLFILATFAVTGSFAIWMLLAIGLCNSIMFPTIFTMALEGLGERTGQGSGILCTAIVGGAVLPALQGALADHSGLRWSFVIPALCYTYIVWYALRGSRPVPAIIA
jgi:FHS family L-fucose permease-like MFS transporter